MKKLHRGMIVVALLVTNTASCNVPLGRLFHPYRCVSDRPNKNDIAGVWTPDEATAEDIQIRGGYRPIVSTKLTLRADGSFELENMPDWWKDGFGEPRGGFESGSGNWELSSDDANCWNVNLKFHGQTTSIGLSEHKFRTKAGYVMEIVLGDPDSGEEMIFVRVANAPGSNMNLPK